MKTFHVSGSTRIGLSSLVAVFLVFCGGSTPTAPAQGGNETVDALEGTWGGSHIQMVIEGPSVRIEFDCAHATLTRPSPDTHGAFSVNGSYFQEHGGPAHIGEEENAQPAEFRGSVNGATMALEIFVGKDRERMGPFTLKHNEQGRVMKCL